jgi:hypothetical protein
MTMDSRASERTPYFDVRKSNYMQSRQVMRRDYARGDQRARGLPFRPARNSWPVSSMRQAVCS